MQDFMTAVKSTLVNGEHNVATTENGALGYRTTGKALLDLNFSVSSMRSWEESKIITSFMEAFRDNADLAMKWLFFARDAREGMGERRLFRIIFMHMANNYPYWVLHLVQYIHVYGRYDDLISLLDTKLQGVAFSIIKKTLDADKAAMDLQLPISLLAKWMPSINTSSKESVAMAKKIAKALGISEREYRKMLSSMRKYIDVVEVKMSSKQWDEINYPAVPSRANLLYNKAFLKNDEDRRREYLNALEKGETKINASTLYPHDIVHQYLHGNYNVRVTSNIDQSLEALWKALPNAITPECKTLVVADGSHSMLQSAGKNTSVTALEVTNALAIYFAERMSGGFHNRYITFSETPQFVDFNGCNTLYEKLNLAAKYTEASNTDIAAVFRLILGTAVNNQMDQEDIPTNILILSDMEFDSCGGERCNERLFETITREYENWGYKLPRIVFWNMNNRSAAIPLKENELGVGLVSGFSVNNASMIMSGKTDPYECLVETLMSYRYEPISIQQKC